MQILNTYVQRDNNVGLLIIITVILGLVYLFKDDITKWVAMYMNGFIFAHRDKVWIVLFAIIFIGGFFCYHAANDSHTYVEATIIDTYPVGALYGKYRVHERRGDLWVLEVLEQEEAEEETEEVVE